MKERVVFVENSEVVKAVLPGGTVIGVQVRDAGIASDESDGFAQDVSFSDRLDLDQVGDALEGLAKVVKDAMSKAAPDKASVEFGVEMMVKEGRLTALLVSGSATASIKVTLEWEKRNEADPA